MFLPDGCCTSSFVSTLIVKSDFINSRCPFCINSCVGTYLVISKVRCQFSIGINPLFTFTIFSCVISAKLFTSLFRNINYDCTILCSRLFIPAIIIFFIDCSCSCFYSVLVIKSQSVGIWSPLCIKRGVLTIIHIFNLLTSLICCSASISFCIPTDK